MQVIQDYYRLHTVPEIGRNLPKTAHYIKDQLSSLPCRLMTPTEGAVCAFFDFGKAEALAFRADTDALPVTEETGLPWQSVHPGFMHACGHDGHTAILLELARRISKAPGNHNVLLIFQPAEETDGGAQDICKAGVLQEFHVKYMFALHLWPGLPKGQLFSRPGGLMSSAYGVKAEFSGRSVHIADHKKGADALAACCEFCYRSEKITADASVLLKFGKLTGGVAENILCGRAELLGSLRGICKSDLESMKHRISELCTCVAKKYGCTGKVTFRQGYPAVWNDEALFQRIQAVMPVSVLDKPYMTAEDFSFYQQQVPGVYFLLGIGNTPPLHSPQFAFDPNVLPLAANLLSQLLHL